MTREDFFLANLLLVTIGGTVLAYCFIYLRPSLTGHGRVEPAPALYVFV